MTEQSATRELAKDEDQRRSLWTTDARAIRPAADPKTRLFWG